MERARGKKRKVRHIEKGERKLRTKGFIHMDRDGVVRGFLSRGTYPRSLECHKQPYKMIEIIPVSKPPLF